MFDATEIFEERAAVMEFDGGMGRAEAEQRAKDDMHRCEIEWCMRNFYPNGAAMAAHLDLVERKRGKPAAMKLRVDLRKAWKERQGAK